MTALAPKTGRRFGPLFPVGVVAAMFICAVGLWYAERHWSKSLGSVLIDGRIRVTVEVADTYPERELGLSGHAPLGPEEGMLFVFDRADRYGFWMKDMLFPLDFLWIRDGVIVDLTTDVPAPTPGQTDLPAYFPHEPADQVLEVSAGFVASHGLKLGLPVEYRPGR